MHPLVTFAIEGGFEKQLAERTLKELASSLRLKGIDQLVVDIHSFDFFNLLSSKASAGRCFYRTASHAQARVQQQSSAVLRAWAQHGMRIYS
jgi:hypothetical protein